VQIGGSVARELQARREEFAGTAVSAIIARHDDDSDTALRTWSGGQG